MIAVGATSVGGNTTEKRILNSEQSLTWDLLSFAIMILGYT